MHILVYFRELYEHAHTLLFQGIVRQMMNKYNKSISEEQTDKLLAHTSSENPLWITVACEELCLFHISQEIDEKIECLPEGLLK